MLHKRPLTSWSLDRTLLIEARHFCPDLAVVVKGAYIIIQNFSSSFRLQIADHLQNLQNHFLRLGGGSSYPRNLGNDR